MSGFNWSFYVIVTLPALRRR